MIARDAIKNSDIADIARDAATLVLEKKGADVCLLDLKDVNSFFNYFLLTSGNSHTHCRALARELEKYINSRGMKLNTKPNIHSGWIVLDYDELVIHIFTEDMRQFYQLEKLWADAPKTIF